MESTSNASIVPLSVEKPRRKRTLDDKACEVCKDKSTGKHYGVFVCDGCSGFFKRTVRRSIPWVCRNDGNCVVDRASRTDCRACRFKKCLMVNMNPEGVHAGSRTSPRERNTESESETNFSFSMNTSSEFDQPTTIVQTIGDDSREKSSSVSTPTSYSLPVSSTSPVSMALAGGSGVDFENRPESHVLIKVETERCDQTIEAQRNPEIVDNHSETMKKDDASSHIPRQSTARTSLATVSQPVEPVVSPVRGTQQLQLVPTQMVDLPNTSFTRRYPYQSTHFFSTSLVTTPRYALTDRQNCSPEMSLPPGAKESLNKMAVQLLSNSVQFAKNIPSFKSLAFRDQVILLEESWKDLFIIDAAFWSFPLEISHVVPPGEATKEVNAPLVSSLRVLQELVTRVQALELDETECVYLKTVVIFKPDIKGLKDSQQIEKLQDEAQVKLSEYVRKKCVENPARFGRLLLTLLAFERVSQDMIEKLFFRAQSDSIEFILHDLFKRT